MTASRLLVDVIGEWRACEEFSRALEKRPHRKTEDLTERDKRSSTLASTIESEVIPRLMLSHSLGSAKQLMRGTGQMKPTAHDITELARLVLEHDSKVARSFIETLTDRGVSVESIFTDLLAPSARMLGDLWREDLCDFTDVTVGLSRLQHLLHEFSPAFEEELGEEFSGRRILLVPCPGEQHTFGIMIVEEFFRRAGWECCTSMPTSIASLVKLVRRERFDVVGVSASAEATLAALPEIIGKIRNASLNPGTVVLVGGPAFLEHPEHAARVGADGTAEDGRQAVLQLRSLFDKRISGKTIITS
jgi:MerR family transcriptional regulator, light-induced transcriptional regulator